MSKRLLKLEDPNLTPFEPIVRSLFENDLCHGINYLIDIGKENEMLDLSDDLREEFIGKCHEGYFNFQDTIVEILIQTQNEIINEKNRLKALQQNKDKIQNCKMLIHILKDRLIVIRKISDTLAWTFIRNQNWMARKLYSNQPSPWIDPKEVQVLKEIIHKICERPEMFALITDITSFVHIGDIMLIEMSKGQKKISYIEVKSGKINELIINSLQKGIDIDCSFYPVMKAASIGPTGLKQLERILRQKSRFDKALNVLKSEKGPDPITGVETRVFPKEITFNTWECEFAASIDKARKSKVDIIVIDNCLYALAIRREGINDITDVVREIIYNEKKISNMCSTSKSFVEYDGTVVNFLDSLKDPLFRPIFTLDIPLPTSLDVLFRRIEVFLHLDFQEWFSLAAKNEIIMSWESPSNNKESKSFLLKGKCLKAKKNDKEMIIGGGIIGRILFELVTPASMIIAIEDMLSNSE